MRTSALARAATGVALAATTAAVLTTTGAAAAKPHRDTGPTPSPTCRRTNDFQYSANYGAPDRWRVAGSALAASDTDGTAWQTAEPSAVGLHVTPATGGAYASSGMIKDLGPLSGLLSGGNVDPAKLAAEGSGPLLRNLYFDTNGNDRYLSFSWDGYYQNIDGDNAGSLDSSNTVDFTTFAQDPGPANLTGQKTIPEIKAAFEARTDGGTKDPEVWEWVGVDNSAGMVSARLTSIAGTAMPTCSTTLRPVARYGYSKRNPAEMWSVYNTGAYARDRSFHAYVKAPGKRTQNLGTMTVKAGHHVTFWSTHGGEMGGNLYISYWDGMGRWTHHIIYSDPNRKLH